MIKAILQPGNKILLGLTAMNIQKLQAGQPIRLDLAELGSKGDLWIVYGDTPEIILKDLEERTGVSIEQRWKEEAKGKL